MFFGSKSIIVFRLNPSVSLQNNNTSIRLNNTVALSRLNEVIDSLKYAQKSPLRAKIDI